MNQNEQRNEKLNRRMNLLANEEMNESQASPFAFSLGPGASV